MKRKAPSKADEDFRGIPILRMCLATAVPMWIEQWKLIPLDEVIAYAGRPEAVDRIAGPSGVELEYRSKKPGGTARFFNAVAQSLGAMAFLPGGVDFLDLHWEARHPDSPPPAPPTGPATAENERVRKAHEASQARLATEVLDAVKRNLETP